jgi:antitoxin component YwqK of YwqJK toxin-antitoxin module
MDLQIASKSIMDGYIVTSILNLCDSNRPITLTKHEFEDLYNPMRTTGKACNPKQIDTKNGFYIFKYDNNTCEVSIKNKLLNGLAIFKRNDKVILEMNLADGVRHGRILVFSKDIDMKLVHIENYVYGVKDGSSISYHDELAGSRQCYYVDGRKHGQETFTHSVTGKIMQRRYYDNGDVIISDYEQVVKYVQELEHEKKNN